MPRGILDVTETFGNHGTALVHLPDKVSRLSFSRRKTLVDPGSRLEKATSEPDEEGEAADKPQGELRCMV